MRTNKTQALLFVFISFLATAAQEPKGLEIIIRSQEVIRVPASDIPTDFRVNLQVRNESQKDIYIFGRKDEDGFEPLLRLLAYDDTRNEWLLPRLKWQQVSDDDRKTYRLRKGDHHDFYTTLSRRVTERKYKVAIYYAYSRNKEPSLLRSEEFSVEKAP